MKTIKRLPLVFSIAALSLAFFSPMKKLSAADPSVIPLWPEGVPGLSSNAAPDKDTPTHSSEIHYPSITYYPAPQNGSNSGTAVVVCPGGGYFNLSMQKEGRNVANWLNSIGVSAFVLKYRLKEYGQPAPLRDVLRAVRIVRSRAAEFGVSPDRIGVLGFSAGGHLASTAVTLFDAPEGRTGAAIDATSARPDFGVLVYPVITMRDPYAHKGSRKYLLGENPSEELVSMYSTDERVTKDTPPVFLVHGSNDQTVPVQNSVQFYLALCRENVPAEMHLFEKGYHGFGTMRDAGNAATWIVRCEAWMRGRNLLAGELPALKSGVYEWDKLKVVDTKTGQRRALFDGTTTSFRSLESHVTTLAPGAVMHAAPGHKHADEELFIVKEGTMEVIINGKTQLVPQGSLVFFASGDVHAMRNASADKPATYYVLRLLPRETLTPAQ